MLMSLDLLLKNYPEPEVGQKSASALFTSVGLNEAEIRAEAEQVMDWAQGKTKEDVAAALRGEGDSVVAVAARAAKVRFELSELFSMCGGITYMENDSNEMFLYPCRPTNSGCTRDTLELECSRLWKLLAKRWTRMKCIPSWRIG